MADRDRREGEAKERGRGPKKREPHTGGKKRGNALLRRSESERQGQRRDREPSSLTRSTTREGRKTRAPGLSYTLK